MPVYSVHFGEFAPGVNPTEYALEKYRALHASYTTTQEGLSNDLVESIRRNFSQANNGSAPTQDESSGTQKMSLAEPADFPPLDSAMAARVAKLTKCVLEEIHRDQPLAAGEILAPDGEFVTYLLAAWHHHPAGRVVVRRRTNQALTYYILPEWQAENDTLVFKKLVDKQTDSVPTQSTRLAMLSGGSNGFLDFFEPGADFMKLVVWGIPPPGSSIASGILAVLFPPKPHPIDWEKVYKRFAQIVREVVHSENVQQTVEEQTGILDTQLDLFKLDYVAMKKEKTPRSDLFHYLQGSPGLVSKVLGVVDTMKQNEFKFHGFGAFMLAATIEILLYQESAMVDPQQKDPDKSTWVGVLKQRADSFVRHAEEMIPQLIQQAFDHRISQITAVQERTDEVNCKDIPTYGGGPPPYQTGTQRMCDYDHYCFFENEYEGWQSQKYRPGGSNDPKMQDAVNKDRNTYISQKTPGYKTEIINSFAKARQTIEAWKLLQQYPLQKPENRPKVDI